MFYKIIALPIFLLFFYNPNYISFAQHEDEHDHDHDHEAVIDSTVQTADTVKSVIEDTVQPNNSDETVKVVTVPASTKIKIIINSQLGTDRSFAGSTFSASLADDLLIDTIVVSPKNSLVVGKIVESKKAQGLGDAILSIQITEITINDQLVSVDTNPITIKGKRKRNAEAEIPAGTIEEVVLMKALEVELKE